MRPWDERKNERNQSDHGISFEAAWLVFDDEFAITVEDYLDDNNEMRYQTVGLVQRRASHSRARLPSHRQR
jgi:uncharacterized protein